MSYPPIPIPRRWKPLLGTKRVGARDQTLLKGVSEGFDVTLELNGVGFGVAADLERNVAKLWLGFSNVIEMILVNGDVFLNDFNSQLL